MEPKEKRKSSVRYAPEVRERAVRMVREHTGEHASQWEAIGSIAAKIGCTTETLRKWVRQAERERGARSGPTTAEHDRIKGLGGAGAQRGAESRTRARSAFWPDDGGARSDQGAGA